MVWTNDDYKDREEKLRLWLGPKVDGGEAGRLAGESYEVIAAALAKHFNRKISKWSARLYVRQAWLDSPDGKPLLHRGGYPKGVQRRKENLATQRSRPSRAKKVTPVAGETEAQIIRDTRIALFQEIMRVCGISASHLHRLLKNCSDLKDMLGSKSNFHQELSASSIKPKRILFNVSPARDDLALALSIHQLVLLGPGCLRVVLLACELRSLYINAAVFELTVPWPLLSQYLKCMQPTTVRRGAPPRQYDTDWLAKLDFSSGGSEVPVSVTLPEDAIAHFVQNTCDRLAVPVLTVFLGNSLGDAGQIATRFSERQPTCDYQIAPGPKQQYLPIQSFQNWTTEEFRVELAKALNQHNQSNAKPELDCRVKKANNLKTSAKASRQEGNPARSSRKNARPTDAVIGERIFQLEHEHPKTRHRGTHLACTPIRLHCVGSGSRE